MNLKRSVIFWMRHFLEASDRNFETLLPALRKLKDFSGSLYVAWFLHMKKERRCILWKVIERN